MTSRSHSLLRTMTIAGNGSPGLDGQASCYCTRQPIIVSATSELQTGKAPGGMIETLQRALYPAQILLLPPKTHSP